MAAFVRIFVCVSVFMFSFPEASANVFFANLTRITTVGQYPKPVPDTYNGTAVISFVGDSKSRQVTVSYTITQNGLDNILNLQLSVATDASNGSPVIQFSQYANLTALYEKGQISGTFFSNKNLTDRIEERPEEHYVVVSTSKYSAGAIRGTLMDQTESFTDGLEPNANAEVNMTYDQVVSNDSPQDGGGRAKLFFYYLSNGSVYLEYEFDNFTMTDVTSVALYAGGVGVNGALQIDLTPAIDLLSLDANGFAEGGLIVSSETVFLILNDPSVVYCQINSTEYPKGAARGQLKVLSYTLASPPGTPAPLADVNYAPQPPAPNNTGSGSQQLNKFSVPVLLTLGAGMMAILVL